MFDNLSWFEMPLTSDDMRNLYYLHAEEIDHNRHFFFEQFGARQLDWFRAQLLNVWN